LSHKNPVLCLQWFPSNVEIDKKNIQNYSTPNPPNEIHQFATISCDGMILIWDNRFLDPKDKKGTTVDYSTI
jgi:WD40 repeat protein